jgi:hypothetical protein
MTKEQMMRSAIAAAAIVVLAGCAAPQRNVVTIHAPFNEAEARAMLEPGTNTIRGSGFMRQRGGGVVTCAGSHAYLVPATAHARERFAAIYGTNKAARSMPEFQPDLAAYKAASKQTVCNAQGAFTFERVKDGEYFVTTGISWTVGGAQQGGAVYSSVRVRGGEAVEVVLSP